MPPEISVAAALAAPDDYVVTFDFLGWSLTHADNSDRTGTVLALTEAEALSIVAAAKAVRGY